MDAVTIVLCCFALVISEVLVAISVFWFYKSRAKPMIKSRKPVVSLIFASIVAFHVAFTILVKITYGPPRPGDCQWQGLINSFATSGRASAISVRSYLLWQQSKTQKRKIHDGVMTLGKVVKDETQTEQESRTKTPSTNGCFVKYQNRPRWLCPVGICIWFYFMLFFAKFVETATCKVHPGTFFTGLVALTSVLLALASILTVKEAFMIKFELMVLFLCIAFQAFTRSLSTPVTDTFSLGDVMFLLAQAVMLFMLIGFPLLLQNDADRVKSVVEKTFFERFLQERTAKRFFREYLMTEFSVENLYFWEACQYHKKNPTVVGALRIYTMFISEHSKSQVNVSFVSVSDVELRLQPFYPPAADEGFSLQDLVCSEELQHDLEGQELHLSSEETQLLSEVFDIISKEVANLMEGDTFPRFLSSGHYKRYNAEIAVANLLLSIDPRRV